MAYLETDEVFPDEYYVVADKDGNPIGDTAEPHWTPYESEAVLKQRSDMARRNWIATGRV